MKLNITRKKKTESISVENNRVNEIRKETQLDVNLELSDIPKSLVDFVKKAFVESVFPIPKNNIGYAKIYRI